MYWIYLIYIIKSLHKDILVQKDWLRPVTQLISTGCIQFGPVIQTWGCSPNWLQLWLHLIKVWKLDQTRPLNTSYQRYIFLTVKISYLTYSFASAMLHHKQDCFKPSAAEEVSEMCSLKILQEKLQAQGQMRGIGSGLRCVHALELHACNDLLSWAAQRGRSQTNCVGHSIWYSPVGNQQLGFQDSWLACVVVDGGLMEDFGGNCRCPWGIYEHMSPPQHFP